MDVIGLINFLHQEHFSLVVLTKNIPDANMHGEERAYVMTGEHESFANGYLSFSFDQINYGRGY